MKKATTYALLSGSLVLLVVAGLIVGGVITLAGTTTPTGPTTNGGDTIITTDYGPCNEDGKTTWAGYRYRNTENDGSTEYLSISTAYEYEDGIYTYTTLANDTSTTLNCKNGDYEYVLAASTSAESAILTIPQEELQEEMPKELVEGAQKSDIKIRAYDEIDRSKVYDNAGTTTYTDANVTFNSTTASSAYDWSDNSGSLDWCFDLRAQTSDTRFGGAGGGVACVWLYDTEMEDPEITLNGADLDDDASAVYDANDDPEYTKISSDNPIGSGGVEYCYRIGHIKGDEDTELCLNVDQTSGQTASNDVYVYFYEVEYYQDLSEEKQLGVYTDASTKTAAGGRVSYLQIDAKS